MADGSSTEESVRTQFSDTNERNNENASADEVIMSDSVVTDEIIDVTNHSAEIHEGITEDDCRKKRCVDRYDSSESSDSGVAVLSCTDCSGSSTASSDITDPGSPFSTGSNHSEDSGAGGTHKMPPANSSPDHGSHWPWTTTSATTVAPPAVKRALVKELTASKRLKKQEDTVPSPSDKIIVNNNNIQQKLLLNNSSSSKKVIEATAKLQHQGKITEYFKSQIKANVIKEMKPTPKITTNLVDKNRKPKPRTIPRKILPAPSKIPTEKVHVPNLPNLGNFTNHVTLTAVSFPSNLAYIHTKSPKPPDSLFVPQFTNKLNTIPCLNVLQPMQKIATLNNFNLGVKLNATMVPIVKLNTLHNPPMASVPFSIETAVPTVLSAKPKVPEVNNTNISLKASNNIVKHLPVSVVDNQCRNEEKEEPYRTEESQCKDNLKPPSPDSDSGISSSPKNLLEISIKDDEAMVFPEQKSPILSKPKIIRFPCKRDPKEELRKVSKVLQVSQDGVCRWKECLSSFSTSGALLDHLQIKHVISQTDQEHYVCFWTGCKVHGRTSCSRSWLERHVLAHAGTKPFRCIVDGCGQRFNSQIMLERHVNGHFNTDGTPNTSAKKTTENGPAKMFKRNGKKIRFRRQPWSARMFDFIDNGIMEGLQHKLLTMTNRRTLGKIGNAGDTVNLQSQIMARRTDTDGSIKILVRWHPRDVILDEWVCENEYKTTKLVPIPVLDSFAKDALKPSLFPEPHDSQNVVSGAGKRKKNRRKFINNQT